MCRLKSRIDDYIKAGKAEFPDVILTLHYSNINKLIPVGGAAYEVKRRLPDKQKSSPRQCSTEKWRSLLRLDSPVKRYPIVTISLFANAEKLLQTRCKPVKGVKKKNPFIRPVKFHMIIICFEKSYVQ